MGTCDCSGERKKDQHLLSAAEQMGKATTKNSKTAGSKSKTKSNQIWYVDPDPDQKSADADVMAQLLAIVGPDHEKDIQAAIKSASDANDLLSVCERMIAKKENTSITDVSRSETVMVTTNAAFLRLMTALEAYVAWTRSSASSRTRTPSSLADILAKTHKLSALQILNDYLELLAMAHRESGLSFERIYSYMQRQKIVIPLNESSTILARVFADGSEKRTLYASVGVRESAELVLLQLLDRVYVYFAYSFDVGLRLTMKEQLRVAYASSSSSSSSDDDEKDRRNGGSKKDKTEAASTSQAVDEKLVCMQSILAKGKQTNLKHATTSTTRKFVSQSQSQLMFFYDEKEKTSEEEIMVGDGETYAVKDWVVAAKLDSLKQEFLQVMDAAQFAQLERTAQLYVESAYRRASKTATAMTVEHIVAVLAYCNVAALRGVLQATYVRQVKDKDRESDHELRKRHSAWVHFARTLQASVRAHGSLVGDAHTLYFSMPFDGVTQSLFRFGGAISMTQSMVVAYNYATTFDRYSDAVGVDELELEMVLLQLDGGELALDSSSGVRCLDCAWLSDAAAEREQLLFASDIDERVELSNVWQLGNTLNMLHLQVSAFKVLCLAFGEVNAAWSPQKRNPLSFSVKKQEKKVKKMVKRTLDRFAGHAQPHLFGRKLKKSGGSRGGGGGSGVEDADVLAQMFSRFVAQQHEMTLFWLSETTTQHWPWMADLQGFMRSSMFCVELGGDKRAWLKLDLLCLLFVDLRKLTVVDCALSVDILNEVEAFLKKLKMDPEEKRGRRSGGKTEVAAKVEADAATLARDESVSDADKLFSLDINVDALIGDLKSEKSHISFHDSNFDDFCDYRVCKISEIAILESLQAQSPSEQQSQSGASGRAFESAITSNVLRKYNTKYKKVGWEITQGTVFHNANGFIIRKIGS